MIFSSNLENVESVTGRKEEEQMDFYHRSILQIHILFFIWIFFVPLLLYLALNVY